MQQQTLNNRYELGPKVGEGGMARVYRGRDLRLGRTVAIKVLHPQYASDPGFLRRFNHEAQAAANLNHPGIVDVFDVGQDGDFPYIVMEYVDGSDLKTLILRQAPLPVDEAVAIAEQVALALDAAHRVGLVHRDIKPQNIIITPDGRAKITDFGIAKSNLSTSMTETGVIFGTADYLSPEQARGQQATPRSDIYSLGVTLYEMLTGRLPFTGESSIAVAMQQINGEPPPPRMYNPRIPPRLEALVLQALSKDPAQRPASGRAFAQQLRDYRGMVEQETVARTAIPQTVPPRPAPARQPSRPALTPAAPVSRTTLPPPRRQAPAPPQNRGSGFGGFILGLLLLGGILGIIYVLLTTNILRDLFNVTANLPRPPAVSQTATEPTTTAVPLAVVPSISGLTREEALQQITDANLRPEEAPPRNSDTVEVGKVIDQFPLAGTSITETSTVTFAISLGAESLDIPNVKGFRPEAAETTLRTAGFNVERAEEPSTSMPAGFVTRTDPAPPARPQRGDTITMYVSIGNKVRVPDVTGMSVENARKTLADAGLTVSYVDEQGPDKIPNFDQIAPNTVVSHVPRGGELVDRGSGVTLGVRRP